MWGLCISTDYGFQKTAHTYLFQPTSPNICRGILSSAGQRKQTDKQKLLLTPLKLKLKKVK